LKYVSGTVTTTAWAGSVVITGDTVVPSGETLTIMEGTSVLFMFIDQNSDGIGDYDLTINGTLKIEGSADKPVIITVYATKDQKPKAWNRITLSGTNSEINNAVIEYAETGLEIKDNSKISDTLLRNSNYGIRVLSPANTTMEGLTVKYNLMDGLAVTAGTASVSGSEFSANGKNGIYVSSGTFNLTLSTAKNNEKCGIEFFKGGGGQITKNNITGNKYEGLRITTDGLTDPTPVINYNNIFDNAKLAGRVVTDVGISVSTSESDVKTATSSAWSTPNSETIDLLYVDYNEYDYSSSEKGVIRKDSSSGSEIYSWASETEQWADVSSGSASKIVAQVADSSSYYSGSISVLKAAYMKPSQITEISVITQSAKIDLRHNYFGIFPDVLNVITLGKNDSANIQGFIGEQFDATWNKGNYFGGETLSGSQTWIGEVYITGDLTVNSSTTLTVNEGTDVLFAGMDQDKNNVGDYSLIINGTINVNGASASPVTFTVDGSSTSANNWKEVRVTGSTSAANITYAVFQYGNTGLHLESGTHVLSHVTANNNETGFLFKSANNISADYLTSKQNTGNGIFIDTSSNITLNHSLLDKNGYDGVQFSGSTSSVNLKNSTITYNSESGIRLIKSGPNIDHCNINYNSIGVKYEGNSTGSVSFCNLKYNKREGIFLLSKDLGNPNPSINSNNIYGNSVTEGGMIENPDISASTSEADVKTSYSGTWNTPKSQNIFYIMVKYTEYDYSSSEKGIVKKDSSSGNEIFSTASDINPARFQDISAEKASKIIAGVIDSSSYYSGSIWITNAFYYVADVLKKELSAVTDAGTVNCKDNYWGTFEDVMTRFTLARSDAIDFQGFVGNEVTGTGPQ
jgi:hypothetical protein